jgi:hypothetical protein
MRSSMKMRSRESQCTVFELGEVDLQLLAEEVDGAVTERGGSRRRRGRRGRFLGGAASADLMRSMTQAAGEMETWQSVKT